jgi:hypothetical protein
VRSGFRAEERDGDGGHGFVWISFFSSRSRSARKSGKVRGNCGMGGFEEGACFRKRGRVEKQKEESRAGGRGWVPGCPRYEQVERKVLWKGIALSGKRGCRQAGCGRGGDAECTGDRLQGTSCRRAVSGSRLARPSGVRRVSWQKRETALPGSKAVLVLRSARRQG